LLVERFGLGLAVSGQQLREEVAVDGGGRLEKFQFVVLAVGGEVEGVGEGGELAEDAIFLCVD
jgi:hypothetical protein